jgi:hypothetical protein
MCTEFNVTGVLVANKNKAGTMSCTIPSACNGKIIQTTFLDQEKFFGYLVKVCPTFLNDVYFKNADLTLPLFRHDGHLYHRFATLLRA